MSVTISTTNKPWNPRAQDLSPKGYNRASLYSGKALDFDGVNDYVDLAGFTMSGTSFSVSFYAKPENAYYFFDSNLPRFLSKYENGFQVYNSIEWTNYGVVPTDSIGFFTIVNEGTTQKAFFNGIQIGNDATITAINLGSTSQFAIGNHYTKTGVPFNGQIAGFRIFNTALTAAQVSDLYLNPEKIVPDGVANSALKLWLPMMEGAGTTAYDGSGNGNHGTINGATWVSGVGAPVAQTALVGWNKTTNLLLQSNSFDTTWSPNNATLTSGQTGYDGSSNAWLITKSAAGGRIVQNITASGIVTGSIYLKANASNWALLQLDSTPDAYVYVDLINGVKGSTGGGNIDATITSVGGGWYRVSVTTNSTTRFRIYPAEGNGNVGAASGNIYIQDAQLTATSDIQPYVETLATAQTSPVLLPQGLTASKDITGVNSVSRNAYALNLDGKSWAEVHDNASLDITPAMTMEVWAQMDAPTGHQMFFNKRTSTLWASPFSRYAIRASSTNVQWWFESATYYVQYDTTLSGWNHFLVTKNGTSEVLYLNGVQVATYTGSATISDSAFDLQLGKNTSGSESLTGQLALPRIYNRALTATEVSRNYNADKSKFGL